jgi:D-sedoheptulose 7-phosphate isomerase
MKNEIIHSIDDGIRALEFLKEPSSVHFIEQAIERLSRCYEEGGKILVAGNGGSLCDAMHFAEELTGVYRHKRPALAAIALSDPGHMSCVANDLGFDQVFSRSIEALGKKEDVFVALTTSGNSSNLIEAVQTAKKLGIFTVCFLGKTGGKLKGMGDLELIISGFPYSDRIQEAHMTVIHILIEQIEKRLFYSQPATGSPSLCHVS